MNLRVQIRHVTVLFFILFLLLPSQLFADSQVITNGSNDQALPLSIVYQLPFPEGEAWKVTSGFGQAPDRASNSPHNYLNGGAVDFAPKVLSPGEDTSEYWVVASASGKVADLTSCYVSIAHSDGSTSHYYHLDNIQPEIKLNGQAAIGQKLGNIANNYEQATCNGGGWTGPHLHFFIRPQPHMENLSLSGWVINYDENNDVTSFTNQGVVKYVNDTLQNNLHITTIVSRNSGKFLDVAEKSLENGAAIQQWDGHYEDNQRWIFAELPNKKFNIVSTLSSKCLDVTDFAKDEGALIQQWECTGAANQEWSIRKDESSGYYEIFSEYSGQCLSVHDGSIDNGALIEQSNCQGADNQLWSFLPPEVEDVLEIGDLVHAFYPSELGVAAWKNPSQIDGRDYAGTIYSTNKEDWWEDKVSLGYLREIYIDENGLEWALVDWMDNSREVSTAGVRTKTDFWVQLALIQEVTEVPYADVSKSHPNFESIAIVTAYRMFRGFSNGIFDPQVELSRKHSPLILFRWMFGREPSITDIPDGFISFPDVNDPNDVSHIAIEYFAQRGWTAGKSDGNYDIDNPVTQAELVSQLIRVLQDHPVFNVIEERIFAEPNPTCDALEAVQSVHAANVRLACYLGIVESFPNATIDFESTISRAQSTLVFADTFLVVSRYTQSEDTIVDQSLYDLRFLARHDTIYLPSCNTIFSRLYSGDSQMYSLNSDGELLPFSSETENTAVYATGINPTDQTVYIVQSNLANHGAEIYALNPITGETVFIARIVDDRGGTIKRIDSISFNSTDGSLWAMGQWESEYGVMQIDLSTGQAELIAQNRLIKSTAELAWSSNGEHLYITYGSGLFLLDNNRIRFDRSFKEAGEIKGLEALSNGNILVSNSNRKEVRMLEIDLEDNSIVEFESPTDVYFNIGSMAKPLWCDN